MRKILILLAACAGAFSGAVSAQQQAAQPSPEIVQFQKLEDQWSNALIKQDQYGLENLISPAYIDISSGGDITTRNQQIALLYEHSAQPVSMEQRVVNVRTIEDVAVVDGTYIQRWKENGSVREERGIFTHIYQHARGNWVCVNSQRTPVVERAADPNQKKSKNAAKKSNAELPFHIPLLVKGKDPSQTTTDGQNTVAPQQ